MTAYVPIIAALVGAAVFVLSSNAKASELGRLTFAAGAFATLFAFAGRMVHLFG